MRTPFFPCALNVEKRPCLVVGDGTEAMERAVSLARAGARVTVIGSVLEADLRGMKKYGVKVQARPFKLTNLKGFFFVVFCIKTDPKLTREVAKVCRKQRTLLCAIDQPQFCDVINVSVYERGALQIAIGTNGVSPGLSRRIRLGLEESLKDTPLEDFVQRLAELRARVTTEIKEGSKRRETLLQALDGFEFTASIKLPRGSEGIR